MNIKKTNLGKVEQWRNRIKQPRQATDASTQRWKKYGKK